MRLWKACALCLRLFFGSGSNQGVDHKKQQVLSAGVCVAYIAQGCVAGLSIIVIARFVNSVGVSGQGIWTWSIALAAVELSGVLTGSFQGILFAYWRSVVEANIQYRMAVMVANSPLLDVEHGSFHADLSVARREATGQVPELLSSVLAVVSQVVAGAGVAAAVYTMSRPAVLLLMLGAVPGAVLVGVISRRRYGMFQRERLHRETWYFEEVLAKPEAAKEVRTFELRSFLLQRYRALVTEMRHSIYAQSRLERAAGTAATMIGVVVLIAALGLSGVMVVGRPGGLGDFVGFVVALTQLSGVLSGLSNGVAGVLETSVYLDLLVDFLEKPVGEVRVGERWPVMASPGGIAVEGLGFQYPSGGEDALRDVTFKIEPGERVAIVGANGAGKSTLIKLLLGLYEPGKGSVRVHGLPIAAISRSERAARMVAAFQDYLCPNLPLAEVVAFGAPMRSGRISDVLQEMGLGDVVAGGPAGLDTEVGTAVGARGVSGGQWQRLAVSRAVYRQPEILILDEPTASLDPKAEAEIYERMLGQSDGRTLLVVAHRLGGIRRADKIIVMKAGRVVEVGRHEELMERGGEYASLYSTQARWYGRE